MQVVNELVCTDWLTLFEIYELDHYYQPVCLILYIGMFYWENVNII